jgi:hypothetical protein
MERGQFKPDVMVFNTTINNNLVIS